jgi:hypothetical protein
MWGTRQQFHEATIKQFWRQSGPGIHNQSAVRVAESLHFIHRPLSPELLITTFRELDLFPSTGPVPETWCFNRLENTGRWIKSKNSTILTVVHHRQNFTTFNHQRWHNNPTSIHACHKCHQGTSFCRRQSGNSLCIYTDNTCSCAWNNADSCLIDIIHFYGIKFHLLQLWFKQVKEMSTFSFVKLFILLKRSTEEFWELTVGVFL